MNDFGFKLQNITNTRFIRRILRFSVCILISVIIIIIIKKIFVRHNATNSKNINNIILIKREVSNIKKPAAEKKSNNENTSMSIYEIIDNKSKKNNLVINKTKQNINIENIKAEDDIILDQKMLANKMNKLNMENETNNSVFINNKNIKNVTINKNTQETITIKDLTNIKNKSLIKNLQNKKHIKSGVKVQLAALSSKEGVIEYWNKFYNKYSSLFLNKSYYIEKVKLNSNSTIYRLQVGIFANRNEASLFCKEFINLTNKSRLDCLVINE